MRSKETINRIQICIAEISNIVVPQPEALFCSLYESLCRSECFFVLHAFYIRVTISILQLVCRSKNVKVLLRL